MMMLINFRRKGEHIKKKSKNNVPKKPQTITKTNNDPCWVLE